MHRLFIVLLMITLGCNADPAPPPPPVGNVAQSADPNEPPAEVTDLATNNKVVVPSATTLVPRNVLGKILGEDPSHLEIKQGTPATEKNYQACFVKWPSGFPNAGMMIQVSRNPVYDEYRDWAISYIDSKKSSGEVLPGTKEPVKFNSFDEFGDSGAYSYEAGKYYWRIDRDYVITLAFNIDWDEKKQYKVAKEVGAEIMKKF